MIKLKVSSEYRSLHIQNLVVNRLMFDFTLLHMVLITIEFYFKRVKTCLVLILNMTKGIFS